MAFSDIDWSSDTLYPPGLESWSGEPTRVEPSVGVQAQGITPEDYFPAQYINWALGTIVDAGNVIEPYVLGGLQGAWNRSRDNADDIDIEFDGTDPAFFRVGRFGAVFDPADYSYFEVAYDSSLSANYQHSLNYTATTGSIAFGLSQGFFDVSAGSSFIKNQITGSGPTTNVRTWAQFGGTNLTNPQIRLEVKNTTTPGIFSFIDMYKNTMFMSSDQMSYGQAGTDHFVTGDEFNLLGVTDIKVKGGLLDAGVWTVAAATFSPAPAVTGDVSNRAGSWQRIGNEVHIKGTFNVDTTGFSASTLYTLSLTPPAGFTISAGTQSPFCHYVDQTSNRFNKVAATRVASSLVIELTTGSAFGSTNNFFYECSFTVT